MAGLELIHYSETPLHYDPNHVYIQTMPWLHHKPHGLWVSVKGDDDWWTWCVDNEFCENSLTHACRIHLRTCANIAYITTDAELAAFQAAYATETDYERQMAGIFDDEAHVRRTWPIDWRAVIADYDGLIITPYLYDSRLFGPNWYYGWDCASGCIWHLAAIERVEETVDERTGCPDCAAVHAEDGGALPAAGL
jgi:hypothetical protein